MRALEPVRSGFAVNPIDGVRVHYELFGSAAAGRAIVFSPVSAYIHGRIWKGQVPWFVQRGYRVVSWDGRGSGKSDRPPSGYSPDCFAGDLLAVMDATGIDRAALVGITWAIRWMSRVAVLHPERVSHLISVSSFPTNFDTDKQAKGLEYFLSGADPGGQIDWKAAHMLQDYRALNEMTAHDDFPEPHSTRQIEEFVAWTMESSPEALVAACLELIEPDPTAFYRRIACPTLLIHGSADASVSPDFSRVLQAVIPGSELLIFEGSGHVPIVRDPVRTNLAISEFIERDAPQLRQRAWRRAMAWPRPAREAPGPHQSTDPRISDGAASEI